MLDAPSVRVLKTERSNIGAINAAPGSLLLVLFDASKRFIESSEWIALELRNESSGITGDIASGNKKGWGRPA